MARRAGGRGAYLIGLISGTSADGIDAALVEVKPPLTPSLSPRGERGVRRLRLRAFETAPYPRGLKARLLALDAAADLSHLNVYLGELFARAAIRIARRAGVSLTRIEAIGSHGQTVAHQPHLRAEGPFRLRSTLQIGEPSIIAERTGITTVADFRARDLAAGGQGAPLTPYLHRLLFQDPRRSRLIVNIGGISNMTYLPAARVGDSGVAPTRRVGRVVGRLGAQGGGADPLRGMGGQRSSPSTVGGHGVGVSRRAASPAGASEQGGAAAEQVIAFDCGPGNMLMDGLMTHITGGRHQMDRGGRLAAQGAVHEGLLRRLLDHPFLRQRPPKTTGREAFGQVLIQRLMREGWTRRLSPADLLATATAFTATAIARHARRWVPHGLLDEVIIVGGGANNSSLMRMLRDALAPVPVRRSEAFGVNGKAIEAMAFALLAHETLRGVPSNLPSVTGARRPVVLGKIIPGGAWKPRALTSCEVSPRRRRPGSGSGRPRAG